MTEDRARLRALAEKAGEGPWYAPCAVEAELDDP